MHYEHSFQAWSHPPYNPGHQKNGATPSTKVLDCPGICISRGMKKYLLQVPCTQHHELTMLLPILHHAHITEKRNRDCLFNQDFCHAWESHSQVISNSPMQHTMSSQMLALGPHGSQSINMKGNLRNSLNKNS